MSHNYKKFLFVSLALLVLSQSCLVECKPKPKSKSKKMGSAIAGGLAGAAVGALLTSHFQSGDKHHYHYPSPQYPVPVVVQSPPVVPVYTQQAVVPVYQQQQQHQPIVAPIYQQPQPQTPIYQQQQPQAVAPVYQQQQQQQQPQATVPVYQQQQPQATVPVNQPQLQQPIATATAPPAVIAVNTDNPSVTHIIYGTNQTRPLPPATNQTQYPYSAHTGASASQPSQVVTTIHGAAVPPNVPAVTQQFVPVMVQPQPTLVQMTPVSTHHGKNAENRISSNFIAMLLLPILTYFI